MSAGVSRIAAFVGDTWVCALLLGGIAIAAASFGSIFAAVTC